jgi:hypothetical protein
VPKVAKQSRKAKDGKKAYRKDDLWIAPSFSFKRTMIQSDWKLRRVEPPENNKFLELANIALGLSTTERHKKKGTA